VCETPPIEEYSPIPKIFSLTPQPVALSMPNGYTLREVLGASVDLTLMIGFSNRIRIGKNL